MQSLINKFGDTKLAVKFGIVFVLLGIGFGSMGFAYYKTMQTQRESLQKASQIKRFSNLVDEIQLHLLEVNRNVMDFEIAQVAEDLNAYNATMADIDTHLVEINTLMRSGKDKQFVDTIRTAATQYRDSFHAAVEVAKKVGLFRNVDAGTAGLTGAFVEDVIKLTGPVVESADTSVFGKFIALRVAHNDYLKDRETKTPEVIIAAHNALLEAVQHFEASAVPEDAVQVVPLDGAEENLSELQKYTVAVMLSFENLNTSFEKQQQLFKVTETQRSNLDPLLTKLLQIKTSYENQDLQASATIETQIFWMFSGSILLVLVTFLIAISVLKRSVLKPIKITQNTIQRISEGDNAVRSHLRQRDELGSLATALDTMLDEKVQTLIDKQAENETLNDSIIGLIESVFKLSQRDLTVLVPVEEDLTGALADSINMLTESMRKVLADVQSVSVRVKDASSDVQSHSTTVQSLAGQDQSEIKQTLDELNLAVETMQRIAELAKVSNDVSLKAKNTSATAQKTVSQTIDSINEIRDTIHQAEKKIKRLGERSQEIGGIVGLINNIAERTHLLSLNASMHAASAGEAGKSLMVVVDEVQRLAENSREATGEISSLVNNIQLETSDTINVINMVISNVVEGTKLAEQAGERMQETLESTELLVESVDKISTDALGQEKVAERLLNRANTLDESSRMTHQQMTQQTELSSALVNAAAELQASVNVFKLEEAEA